MLSFALAASAGAASGDAAALQFSPPGEIDTVRPYEYPERPSSISCPTARLCVGVGERGWVGVWHGGPRQAGRWSGGLGADDYRALIWVHCPSLALCYALDQRGELVESHDPVAGPSTWQDVGPALGGRGTAVAPFPGAEACPSASLCVAVSGGQHQPVVWTSHAPARARSWHQSSIAGGPWGDAFAQVSCPTTRLCIAISIDHVAVSRDPGARHPRWRTLPGALPEVSGLPVALACPTVRLCAVATEDSYVLSSRNPAAGGATFRRRHIPPRTRTDLNAVGLVCPGVRLCLLAEGGGEILTTSDPTAPSRRWSHSSIGAAPTVLGCPSPSQCLMEAGVGATVSSLSLSAAGARWSRPQKLGGFSSLRQVACPSAQFCVLLDATSALLVSTSPRPDSSAWNGFRPHLGDAPLESLSCPDPTFCVALSWTRIAISNDPGGGSRSWTLHSLPELRNPDYKGAGGFAGLGCASGSFCVATGRDNADQAYIATTTDPGGGAPAWHASPVGGQQDHFGTVACPSSSLCVAADLATTPDGSPLPPRLAVSTNPLGAQWQVVSLSSTGKPITDVSCPTPGFCAATSYSGTVFTSTDPAGGPSAWRAQPVGDQLEGISCGSPQLCVAIDAIGHAYISQDPAAGSPTWTTQLVDPLPNPLLHRDPLLNPASIPDWLLTGVACAASGPCVITDDRGDAIVSAPA